MIKWAELFPIESLGPLAGGALIWFGANYFVLAPNVIGPRLVERYYAPACRAAVARGVTEYQQERQTLRTAAEATFQVKRAEIRERIIGAIRGQLGQWGGGRNPFGDMIEQRVIAAAQPAIRSAEADAWNALDAGLRQHEREAQAGITHKTPAAFCGCAVAAGMGERIDLATYTASLRLYAPDTVERLQNGSIASRAPECGKPPVA